MLTEHSKVYSFRCVVIVLTRLEALGTFTSLKESWCIGSHLMHQRCNMTPSLTYCAWCICAFPLHPFSPSPPAYALINLPSSLFPPPSTVWRWYTTHLMSPAGSYHQQSASSCTTRRCACMCACALPNQCAKHTNHVERRMCS